MQQYYRKDDLHACGDLSGIGYHLRNILPIINRTDTQAIGLGVWLDAEHLSNQQASLQGMQKISLMSAIASERQREDSSVIVWQVTAGVARPAYPYIYRGLT